MKHRKAVSSVGDVFPVRLLQYFEKQGAYEREAVPTSVSMGKDHCSVPTLSSPVL